MYRLLIVEDSPTQAEQLRWSLEEDGFKVDVAPDAEQALDLFRKSEFDLVVSDIVLPGASGYDLCREINSVAGGRPVPVLLLSALNDPMTIIRALQCGADNFLTKPYEPEHLISRIRTAISNRNARAAGNAHGVEVMFLGKPFTITSSREQILDLLMSTFEDIVRTNAELEKSQDELAHAKAELENYARELEDRVIAQTKTLRDRERQLSDAQEIAKLGDWHVDTATQEVRWSDQVFRIFGQDKALFQPTVERVMALFHPDDRDRVQVTLDRSTAGKGTFQLEARIPAPDGTERIAWLTGNPELNAAGEVIGMFGVAQDITERRFMESEMLATGERYRRLFEDTPDAVIEAVDGRISLTNAAALKLLGVNQSGSLVGRPVFDFFGDDLKKQVEARRARNDGGNPEADADAQISGHVVNVGGSRIPVEVTCSTSASMDHGTTHFIMRDISRRIAMEEQLYQAQKMEAVGQLTGGVSHDFNNLLTIIIGNLDFVREEISDPDNADALNAALEAALRGADLNQRLLAFARRQTLRPKPTSVNELIQSTSKLLARALGERIGLNLQLDQDLEDALVDAAQLESAITNLAVNARDAMPDGGELRIRTYRHTAGSEASVQGALRAGEYIVVEVSDTGTGMDPEVQKRACEPFFTTKDEGKGTGLGLSMVHGFMEQSGGTLRIESSPGNGTTMYLFLPEAHEHDKPAPGPTPLEPLRGHGETVLVVEDNEQLRRVLMKQLRGLGYKIVEAGYGAQALEILKEQDRSIDLLLTDIVMPGDIDGRRVAEEAVKMRPDIKVILTSGYSEALAKEGTEGVAEFLLRKPYRREELARIVRRALQEASPHRETSAREMRRRSQHRSS